MSVKNEAWYLRDGKHWDKRHTPASRSLVVCAAHHLFQARLTKNISARRELVELARKQNHLSIRHKRREA